MTSFLERRLFLGIAGLALLALTATSITVASRSVFAGGDAQCADDHADGEENDDGDAADSKDGEENDAEEQGCDQADANSAGPGKLDDGKELLPLAKVSLEQAIAIAQGASSGNLGEVDLEYFKGALVFNIDIGSNDVKVDAATGAVLSIAKD